MPTHTRRGRTSILGALVLGLALVVSGCGTDDSEPDSQAASATEHNDADVQFATRMIQHHAQALTMVDLTLGRKLDPEVEQLAEGIRTAQGPEIETMSDWLTDWGEEVPETMRDHANAGHDMGDMGGSTAETGSDMPGMMSAEDLATLKDASDAEFQRMWLEMMIEHHQGAVEMAHTEQSEGRYRPALQLADDIVTSQSAEIEAMQDRLGS